jgi:hypothetical protein
LRLGYAFPLIPWEKERIEFANNKIPNNSILKILAKTSRKQSSVEEEIECLVDTVEDDIGIIKVNFSPSIILKRKIRPFTPAF